MHPTDTDHSAAAPEAGSATHSPAAPTPPMTEEKKQYLDILAIGFYILAGLAILFGCIPIIHVVFGAAMALGMVADPSAGAPLVGAAFGCFFIAIGGLFVASAWAYGYFMIIAGRALKSRSRYVLCTVMAGISCMFAPFGTIVGVFALVLLLDNSVKREFGVEIPR
ncbi:MAG: hypothetical protein AAGM22_17260 [Acidobacteriota bacterium]